MLRLAAALERGSEHPLATAIVEGAEEREIDAPAAEDFASVTGKEFRGRVESGGRALSVVRYFAEPDHRRRGHGIQLCCGDRMWPGVWSGLNVK